MGKQKWNKDNFINEIKRRMPESQIEVISFEGIVKPFKFKCLKCGTTSEYKTADKCIDRGRRGLTDACKVCEDTVQLSQRLKAIDKVKKLLPSSNICPVMKLDNIKRIQIPIVWKCNKCHQTFERSINNFLLKSQKCPYCEGVVYKHTIDSFLKKMKSLNIEDYSLVGDFNGINIKTLFKHKDCGFIWETLPSNILSRHGCPKCKESKGEKLISNWLKENNIYFLPQYRFTNLKKYPFDFYIEYRDKKICVEFQGKQHYEPISFFGGEEKFKEQIQRDKIKKEFCLKNNIELIEISYLEQKQISTILSKRFNDQA